MVGKEAFQEIRTKFCSSKLKKDVYHNSSVSNNMPKIKYQSSIDKTVGEEGWGGSRVGWEKGWLAISKS